MRDIVIDGMSKAYGDKVVFKGLSLTVRSGVCTVLMGPSGCGKTTLLRILMGLEGIDSGSVSLGEGEEPEPYDPRDWLLSAVFQEDRLVEGKSVLWNLRLAQKAPIKHIENCLSRLGLEGASHKQISLLSGGMKRRVALLRALLREADLYLMDEPFTGLDSESKRASIDYCKERILGKTAVIVTHDEGDARALSGDIVRL